MKTGIKLGILYGCLGAILIVLLNLLYTQRILTLLAIVIYFSIGFAIAFGFLGLIFRVGSRLFLGIKKTNKRISPMLLLGCALILGYSATQYWMDLAEFRFSLTPLSIKLLDWFALIQAISGVLALIGCLRQWKADEENESHFARNMKNLSLRKIPIIFLVITAIAIDLRKPASNTVTKKESEPKKNVAVSQNIQLVSAKSVVAKKQLKTKLETTVVNTTQQNPIIFLGWDGADWSVAQPLMEQGKMPNLKKLVDRGAWGYIKTFRPTLSPAIWTSIATGKMPIKTGIIHFLRLGDSEFFEESLGAVPMNRAVTGLEFFVQSPMNETLRLAEYGLWNLLANDRTNRQTKAVWNIVSEQGKKVGIVNMMITTPVEKVNGYMVSDYLQIMAHGGPDVTYPSTLYNEIKSNEITRGNVTPEQLSRLFPNPAMAQELSKADHPPYDIYYGVLQQSFAEDQSSAKYGEYIFNTYHPDLTIVYFHGPDTVSHFFWKYSHPDGFWGIPEKDKQMFGEMINRYYEMTDEELKPFVDQLDNGATVILCSDHGFEPISPLVEKLHFLTHTFISGDHRHSPPGIVVMAGPQIQTKEKLPKYLNVLDITPALLWFLNIPIAKDMDGDVPVEAVTKEYAISHPPKYVTSYETGEGNSTPAEGSEMSDQYRERLRSLGYIQ